MIKIVLKGIRNSRLIFFVSLCQPKYFIMHKIVSLSIFLFTTKVAISQCVVLTYQTDAAQFGNVNENSTTSQFDKVIELKENTTQITFTNTKSCGEDFDKFLFYNRTNFNANPGTETNYRLFLMNQLTVAVDTLTMRPSGTSDTLYIKVSNGFGSNLNTRKIRIVRKIQVTGLEDLRPNPLFAIFPNPAHEVVSISVNTLNLEGDVYISDVNGKQILVLNDGENNGFATLFNVDVVDWKEGVYFIHYGGFSQKLLILK